VYVYNNKCIVIDDLPTRDARNTSDTSDIVSTQVPSYKDNMTRVNTAVEQSQRVCVTHNYQLQSKI